MKRLLTIGLMLASAFALTNCAEEITAPVQDDITIDGNIENITPPEEEVNIPFEVFATVGGEVETKTQNIGNSTYWVANDRISVFHKTGDKITHNKEFTISSENLASGLFEGGLSSVLGETNDWFFLYPYKKFKAPDPKNEIEGDYSSSGSTLTVKGVQIGAQTQTQDVNKPKGHISGVMSPMYGVKPGLDREAGPEIKMNHLAAIAAIKVVNNTADYITLTDAGLHAFITIKDAEDNEVKQNLPIVGEFSVEMNDNNLQVNGIEKKSFNTAKVNLSEAVDVRGNGGAFTFYFAVSPCKTKLKDLTVYINGSEKAISSESQIEFKAGEVTTLKLEVKPHSYPTNSEAALNLKSQGGVEGEAWYWHTVKEPSWTNWEGEYDLRINEEVPKDQTHAECSLVTMENYYSETININNEDVKVYVLGKASQTAEKTTAGKITIRGWAKDIINALSAGFYTSRWNNQATSMILESINIHIPEYAKKSPTDITGGLVGGYNFAKLITRVPIYDKWGGLIEAVSQLVEGVDIPMEENGITLETLAALGISTSTVTFSGMIPNCGFNDTNINNSNVLMLDEDRTYKWIDGTENGNVATYVDKFSYRPESGDSYVATLSGLRNILNAQPGTDGTITWTSDAEETGDAIYNRICQILATRVGSEAVAQLGLRALGFKDAEAIMYSLRDMKFEVCISTHPVNNNYYPVVLWGLGANVDTSGTSN